MGIYWGQAEQQPLGDLVGGQIKGGWIGRTERRLGSLPGGWKETVVWRRDTVESEVPTQILARSSLYS